jgi:F-type H+-transporting ATPase subunit delta
VDKFIEQGTIIIDLLKEKDDFVKILSVRNLEFEKTKLKIIDTVFTNSGFDQFLVNAMKILVEEQNFHHVRIIFKNMRRKLTSLQNMIYGVA